MTHPDFQSIVQWVSAPLASGTNTAFGVGTTALIPATTLGSYQNLMVRVTSMTSDALFTVFSYDSTTGLLATGQRQIWLRSGQPATFVVPILGGAFAVNLQGAFAGSTITWSAYGTNLPTGLWPTDPTQPLRRVWPSNVIAAGGNASFQMLPYAGNVSITGQIGAQPFSFQITGADLSGTEVFDYWLSNYPANSRFWTTTYIGPTLNTLTFINAGAAGDVAYLTVNAAPQSRELY